MATRHKREKGALAREISKALLDASEIPLFRKREKRKSQEKTSHQPKKAKTIQNNTPEEIMYQADATTPEAPPPSYASADEPSLATLSTNTTDSVMTARLAPFSLSPSKKGDHWAAVWASTISQAPAVHPASGKSYTWPATLTNVLEFV